MREFIIEDLEANQRFDKYLLKLLKKSGKGYIYKMLRKRSITLNGKKVEGSVMLHKGDVVRLYMKDETLYKALYCGVCKSIGKTCGEIARVTLTYDIAFLSAIAVATPIPLAPALK